MFMSLSASIPSAACTYAHVDEVSVRDVPLSPCCATHSHKWPASYMLPKPIFPARIHHVHAMSIAMSSPANSNVIFTSGCYYETAARIPWACANTDYAGAEEGRDGLGRDGGWEGLFGWTMGVKGDMVENTLFLCGEYVDSGAPMRVEIYRVTVGEA